jgi:hypothetical protein
MAEQFGFHAYGIDRDPDRQRVLRNRGITLFPDLDSLRAAALPAIHAVTLFQVLEHVEEPLELLMELRDLMAPGAVLVLEVPNCEGITGIHSKTDYYNIHPLEHMNCFTRDSLRNMAERAGFTPLKRPPAHATTDPVKALKGAAAPWVRGIRSYGTNQYFRRA